MRESDIIAALSAIHGNVPYMADAEVLPFADCSLLFSMDSFSEREDFLHGLAPEMIGHQIACAACSDILACGAVPEWLLQNWCYDQRHDIGFYKHVASGIEYVLKQYGARCVGGDIGTASDWCWTATAVGHSKAPVTRVASARVDFDLYSTGPMGLANAAVFCGRPLPLFALRKPVPQGALFATDTSGGFLDAIENFRRVNHGMSIEVDADALVSPAAIEMLPSKAEPGWTLVGGVG